MSKEKQIEEMASILLKLDDCEKYDEIKCIEDCKKCRATQIYNAGYRKQSVGEWKPQMQELKYFDTCECSICGYVVDISETTDYNFCPNCGARMKGGAECT